jgi:diguanylate cyclase (GGDEF)-like protein
VFQSSFANGIVLFAETPLGVWAFAAAGFVVAAVVGFVAGMHYAGHATRRAVERVKSSLANLYAHVVTSIETAQDACQTLETFPNLQLSLDQLGRLEAKRNSLLESVQRIVDGQQPAVEPEPPAPPVPKVAWALEPQHAVTKLPDRTAFDANRETLSKIAAEGRFSCGLLLVRIDRADHLKSRFGVAGMQNFTRAMAGLICRSMRDADIACQFSPETFAVLMPGVSEAAARETAEAIRGTIRNHHFHSSENGPEVLVTAAFGLTVFAGEDDSALAVDRAENALKRSQKQGRNKLFLDSGRMLVACVSEGSGQAMVVS